MFRDRSDAGAQLASALAPAQPDALVLGIPRGGVVVARVVADALGADLDVVVTHKLGAPDDPELAIGAIGPDGAVVVDERVLDALGALPRDYVERERARQAEEVARRSERYRGTRAPPEVRGRACIVVDDGIATGSTARAALRWLRDNGARDITLAVPVAPRRTVEELARGIDRVVCPLQPETFYAVGQYYADFGEVSDDEVRAALLDRSDDL
jgi:predicted phosphoribosyltransferase